MAESSTDRIEKRIELQAPVSRVWRALVDHREFGTWFRVALEEPFVLGKSTRGRVTYPGYEHIVMELVVEKLEPERLFAFRGRANEHVPYPTLVEFRLEPSGEGTLLTVVESGFDAIPPEQRAEIYRRNEHGWAEQIKNIEAYVTAH